MHLRIYLTAILITVVICTWSSAGWKAPDPRKVIVLLPYIGFCVIFMAVIITLCCTHAYREALIHRANYIRRGREDAPPPPPRRHQRNNRRYGLYWM